MHPWRADRRQGSLIILTVSSPIFAIETTAYIVISIHIKVTFYRKYCFYIYKMSHASLSEQAEFCRLTKIDLGIFFSESNGKLTIDVNNKHNFLSF